MTHAALWPDRRSPYSRLVRWRYLPWVVWGLLGAAPLVWLLGR